MTTKNSCERQAAKNAIRIMTVLAALAVWPILSILSIGILAGILMITSSMWVISLLRIAWTNDDNDAVWAFVKYGWCGPVLLILFIRFVNPVLTMIENYGSRHRHSMQQVGQVVFDLFFP